jgi:hypothetical protein
MNTNILLSEISISMVVFPELGGRTYMLPIGIARQFEEAIYDLCDEATPGEAKTLRQHFGREAWDEIAAGNAKTLGKYMGYLVALGRVPFRAMGIDPNTKAQRYALI